MTGLGRQERKRGQIKSSDSERKERSESYAIKERLHTLTKALLFKQATRIRSFYETHSLLRIENYSNPPRTEAVFLKIPALLLQKAATWTLAPAIDTDSSHWKDHQDRTRTRSLAWSRFQIF